MTLVALSPTVIGPYLAKAWQGDLNTTEDPAGGKWYTNGANNDGVGLYGGLSDSAATTLNLNKGAQQYLPQLAICNSAITDNRNGLTPSANVALAYTYTSSTTYTQTLAYAVTAGASASFEFSEEVEGIGAKQTFTFNLSFTFSYSQATAKTTSNASTFTQSVAVTPPAGRVYKTFLMATVQALTIPYTAAITATGMTETWFEDRINGHYNYMLDAGSAFGMINTYGAAGADSALYSASPSDSSVGLCTLHGTITAQATSDFYVQTIDITDTYAGPNDEAQKGGPIQRYLPLGSQAAPGKLISSTHFPVATPTR
jgi:hypothetical protein